MDDSEEKLICETFDEISELKYNSDGDLPKRSTHACCLVRGERLDFLRERKGNVAQESSSLMGFPSHFASSYIRDASPRASYHLSYSPYYFSHHPTSLYSPSPSAHFSTPSTHPPSPSPHPPFPSSHHSIFPLPFQKRNN